MSAIRWLLSRTVSTGLTQHVTLYGCNVLRRSAGPQFIHAVHVLFNLVPNQLEVFSRHPAHHVGSSCAGVKYGLDVAGRSFGCLLRPFTRQAERATECFRRPGP